MAGEVDLGNLINTPTDPRREVWPSIQYGYFEAFNESEGDETIIYHRAGTPPPAGDDSWIILSRSVLGFVVNLDADGGGAIKVKVSWDGLSYPDQYVFRCHRGTTALSGFELCGSHAKFSFVAAGALPAVYGTVCLRGL